jgi:hypothetical protein
VDDAKAWNVKDCESYLDHMSLQLGVDLKTKQLSDLNLNAFVENPVDIITDLKCNVENMNLPETSPYADLRKQLLKLANKYLKDIRTTTIKVDQDVRPKRRKTNYVEAEQSSSKKNQ